MFAGSQLDMVVGLDLHMEMVPTPAGPVPTPFPMAFVGQLEFKPVDVLIQAGIAKGISWAFSTPPTGPVFVNNFHAAKTGDDAKNGKTLPHVVLPPGAAWTPLPKPLKLTPKPPPPPPDSPASPPGDAVLVTGSKTVYFEQTNACRLGTLAMSCSDPVRLPSSTLIAIPKGMPVLVGGPPAFDASAAAKAFFLRNKWTAGAMQEVAYAIAPGGRWRGLLSWAACQLTGHPVDVATGRLLTRAEDFRLRGPIPLAFERYYSSSWSERNSPLGYGWSHTLDERIWLERGKVVYKCGDGREVEFQCRDLPGRRLRPGVELFYPIDRLWLKLRDDGTFRVRSADGLVREFGKLPGNDATWFLTKISDREGHAITFNYDSRCRLYTVETTEGRWLRLEHDPQGLLKRLAVAEPDQRDGWYNQVTFEYSKEGDLAKAVDSQRHARLYRYASHLLVQETDRDGVRFWFEYDGRDASASCVRTWGSDGKGSDRLLFRELTYDKKNMVTMVEDSFGHVTTYKMNVLNAVVEILDPHGASTKFEYTDQLWKAVEVDANGRATRREYDARGNETKRVLPNGATFTMAYDREDRVVEMIDPLGRRSMWTYEHPSRPGQLLSKPIAVRTPRGLVRFEYDGGERTTITTDDKVFVLDFDRFGQISQITFPDATYEERWYDRQGRLVKTRDSAGRVRRIAYDWESRVVEVDEHGGIVRRVQYSPEGDVIEYRDKTRHVKYGYSGHHKIAWREEGGERVEYRYTSEDDLVAVVNEAGEFYSFTRDACRRLVEEVGFDGRKHVYERNAVGDVATLFKPSKLAQHFTYNELGLVTAARYADGSEETFTYDLIGQLESATNAAGTVRWQRDASGRVLTESFADQWVASKYEGPGPRAGVTSSLGLAERIARGPMGDINAVELWSSDDARSAHRTWSVGFERDALGNELRRTMSGGVTATWSRSEAGLPLSVTVARAAKPLSETRYDWEGDNRLAAAWRSGSGSTSYAHDARNRLTAAVLPDGSTQWRSPSPTGNLSRTRERTDRRYGRGGVLLAADDVSYVYDGDGNLTRRAEPDGSTWSYAWNADGTLAAVTRPDGERIRFEYDALKRRVAKIASSGVTTRWIWDGNVPVHELMTHGETTETTTWLFEPGRLAPLGKIAPDGKKYSVITDYLGTPMEMFDQAGKLAWQAQLDTFGVAEVSAGRNEDCPWRWPGQYEDPDTGLYYNRFRYYAPDQGSYISQDPIGLLGGLNSYAYVFDPLIQSDPLGLSVVIGENQARVDGMASALGAETITSQDFYGKLNKIFPFPLTPEQVEESIALNRQWIDQQIAAGQTIIDIGRDPARTASGRPISPWYAAELEQVQKAKKVFHSVTDAPFVGTRGRAAAAA